MPPFCKHWVSAAARASIEKASHVDSENQQDDSNRLNATTAFTIAHMRWR
jgi:hypothetical protein